MLNAALFGSVARGDNGPDSDIDILIDIEPDKVRDLYTYVGLKTFVSELFTGSVDVVGRQVLRPHLRPPAEGDAIHAF